MPHNQDHIEVWKDINGYGGVYKVSNLGRIKSMRGSEKILSCESANREYLEIAFSKKRLKETFKVHRLVATYFVPNPKNLPIVNHKNGNKRDNRAENLEWCTVKHNTIHGMCLGITHKYLSVGEIIEIKKEFSDLAYLLSKRYGVSPTSILNVFKEKNHKYLNSTT